MLIASLMYEHLHADCLPHHQVFVSQPLVYEHLHEVFWPSVQPGGGDDLGLGSFQIACLVIFNLVALPLLPFVPKACALDDH
jgi:hypothetical protein